MPANLTYPGLYVEEIPSGVHPIAGVSTADTAFIDSFAEGPADVATRVSGFDDFLRRFGPLDESSPAGYGVMQFFVNGGQVAWIVRVAGPGNLASSLTLPGGSAPSDSLVVSAINPGVWGDALQVAVDWDGVAAGPRFNLAVRRIGQVGGRARVIASEVYRNVTMAVDDLRNVKDVVTAASTLIAVADAPAGFPQVPSPTGSNVTSPSKIADAKTDPATLGFRPLRNGAPGAKVGATELTGGLDALRRIEPNVVSLLCIPAAATLDGSAIKETPVLVQVAAKVAEFCDEERCFYLMDFPEGVDTPDKALEWLDANTLRDRNAAVFYPRLKIVDPDPLREGALRDVANSGTMAGLFARFDTLRGVWRAAAGTEAQLRSIAKPSGPKLNDDDSAKLNPLGINAIRTLPVYGTVSWGARTLFGADVQTSEWKYAAVRRTALYIEESLVQGLRWVVFEGNDEPLWAQINLNVGAFMQSMFRRGAFQGRTPREAYLVKCDAETTTQTDIDRGIVNILVGFAPLKPAEFVVIQLQQLTRPADQ